MRTEEEILIDIVSNPECDDLRHEFARAVEARDPEWAKFILVSTSAEWCYDSRPNKRLAARILAPLVRFTDVGFDFHRGFPTRAYIPFETFLEQGEQIMSLAPILDVVLQLRPLGALNRHWNTYLPTLGQCPALARVRRLSFTTNDCFDFVSMMHLIRSPFVERLLILDPGGWSFESPEAADEQEAAMWPLLLESPVFRRMIDWGLRTEREERDSYYIPYRRTALVTRRQLGDVKIEEQWGPSGAGRLTRYESMGEESRALEQTYGYLPFLHAGNWGATVFDVLSGKKPDFPAGAPVTEAMYTVPPSSEWGHGL